jgi:hypothetical protein
MKERLHRAYMWVRARSDFVIEQVPASIRQSLISCFRLPLPFQRKLQYLDSPGAYF